MREVLQVLFLAGLFLAGLANAVAQVDPEDIKMTIKVCIHLHLRMVSRFYNMYSYASLVP